MHLISQRLISILVTSLFLMLMVTIAWYALGEIENKTRNRTRDALQTVLLTTQETLHLWISQRRLDASELARNETLVKLTTNLLSAPKKSKRAKKIVAEIQYIMRPKLSRYGDRGFFIISPERINIASMRDSNMWETNLIHLQRKKYLDSAFNDTAIFIPTIRSDVPLTTSIGVLKDGEPTIFVATPIKNITGDIIAVLAIRINPKRQFTRIIQLGRIGKTGETYAFDEQATLISESRFDDQLRRIGLIGTDSRGILSIRVTDPGGNLLAGYQAPKTSEGIQEERPLTFMASNAIKGNAGYNTTGYRDYRGVDIFGAWLWDKELGFGLATELDVEEAMQPFYETRLTIISIVLIAILLGLILAFVCSRKHH